MKTLDSNGVIKFLIPILSLPQLHFWTQHDAVKKVLNLHTQTYSCFYPDSHSDPIHMKRQQIDTLMCQTKVIQVLQKVS